MGVEILRAADYRRMAWKNGGGETAEIAVWPPHAGLDDFDWRVSMATVGRDGPFSAFAGIDRTLAILGGDGMRIEVAGMPSADLGPDSEPFFFAADRPASARLLGGAVTDLNVMTRRGRFTHALVRQELSGQGAFASRADATLLICLRGSVEIDEGARLNVHDCLLATDPSATIAVEAGGSATLLVATIERVGASAA